MGSPLALYRTAPHWHPPLKFLSVMLENSQEGWHPFARDEPSREYVPHACRAQPEPYRWSGMPRRSTPRATPTPPPPGPGRQPATPVTAPADPIGRPPPDAGLDPLRSP